MDPSRPLLAFVCELGVRTPGYEVDRRFWPERHCEGGYLFRDALVLEVTPPEAPAAAGLVTGSWESQAEGPSFSRSIDEAMGDPVLEVPFTAPGTPGIVGVLRVRLSLWNR